MAHVILIRILSCITAPPFHPIFYYFMNNTFFKCSSEKCLIVEHEISFAIVLISFSKLKSCCNRHCSALHYQVCPLCEYRSWVSEVKYLYSIIFRFGMTTFYKHKNVSLPSFAVLFKLWMINTEYMTGWLVKVLLVRILFIVRIYTYNIQGPEHIYTSLHSHPCQDKS